MAATAARSADRGRHHRHRPGRRAGPRGLRGRALRPRSGLGGFDQQGPAGVGLVGFFELELVGFTRPAGARIAPQHAPFALCMRRHGVTDFPDPNSSGNFPPSAKQVSLSNPHQFQDARTACSDLLPNGGNGPTPAQWQQILSTMVEFAHCMRQHGVPNWPDPTYDTHGRPVFNINVDPNSPQFTGEIHACKHLLVNYGSRPGWPDLSNYFEQSQD